MSIDQTSKKYLDLDSHLEPQDNSLVSVLVPAYNEQGAIKSTIDEIHHVFEKWPGKYEIIIINDGSDDDTAAILGSIQGITRINHRRNKGYGASLKTGLREASGDLIVITDADGTYPNDRILDLLKALATCDMAVGARTGKKVKIPILRRPPKMFLNWLANFISGEKIPDLNSGLRAFKKDVAMRFFNLYPEGFSFTTTITLATLTNDYEVVFMPIDYYQRQGKSKIDPIRDTIGFFVLIIKIIALFKPLKVFFPVSIVIFLLGVGYGVMQIMSTGGLGQLPVLFLLGALQTAMMGLLAEMISKLYNR